MLDPNIAQTPIHPVIIALTGTSYKALIFDCIHMMCSSAKTLAETYY